MEFFNNHTKLFGTAFLLFAALTLFVAIIPAISNQQNNAPLPNAVPLSDDARKGKELFIANGCVACHTQQVRNIDMDSRWGKRPGIAADYAAMKRMDIWRNTATLAGTERTGPDLTDIGNRQPSLDWNLVHLYNPRTVVKESVMPAYPWLFERKAMPSDSDVVVNVPEAFLGGKSGKVVAKPEALQLVAYLQSLKQAELPGESRAPEFLYKRVVKSTEESGGSESGVNGALLYTDNCQACHQADGKGLPGAFPPLANSPIVTGDDLSVYVDIIMNGYDARPEYGAMPGVGTMMGFTADDVAAIINHERSSWGNKGKEVTAEEVQEIITLLEADNK
ncbi:cbb3-type cytochrome c oxidase subunit II [Parapedobacter indicus]|uniref:Cytochrome c oxidase cbb3-type subunit 2 n=2 Tax=Parapedobacter indicus TaxID=1477437 RepID=A0A1I3M0V5_9SPHI|nr:cbb3-type cytochrome c oxidase subunit II [Parapedobacter indicus]PPL01316.1 cytochrome c oxidase cbb3-type subunit 2 [Parapedobacter indicus]SFI90644.1 cytochrome c oxidase cbb3-type subunit 2 [Parapedobacter indicus]